ncbi:MAG: hypothetical protein KatS3mg033_0277 [Thermonema sp.]|nr:MAG: hypothetical protein KatS3mg033_0277 [Thermonema sp.]
MFLMVYFTENKRLNFFQMKKTNAFRLLAQLYLHQEQLERCDTLMLRQLLFSREQQKSYAQKAQRMHNEYLRKQMESLLRLVEEVEYCCLKSAT